MDCIKINDHDCIKIADKVEALVDGELTQEEEMELLAEIRKCPKCLDELNIQKQYKEFIIKKLDRKCCHQEIMQVIRQQLKAD
jgi:hypothetical protein